MQRGKACNKLAKGFYFHFCSRTVQLSYLTPQSLSLVVRGRFGYWYVGSAGGISRRCKIVVSRLVWCQNYHSHTVRRHSRFNLSYFGATAATWVLCGRKPGHFVLPSVAWHPPRQRTPEKPWQQQFNMNTGGRRTAWIPGSVCEFYA